MKFLLASVAVSTVLAGNMLYDCGDGDKVFNHSGTSPSLDEAGCCYTRVLIASVDCTASMCNTTGEIPNEESFGTIDECKSSCVPATCQKINVAGDSHACGSGKVYDSDKWDNATLSDAACCKTFVATCGEADTTGDSFTCGTGLENNPSASASTVLSDATCCVEAFNTCGSHNGALYSCPTGKRFKATVSSYYTNTTGTKADDDALCCETYTVTCGFLNDAGDDYTCPSGQIEKNGFSDIPAPSDANCCEAATTCYAVKQQRCVDYNCGSAAVQYNCPGCTPIVANQQKAGSSYLFCCESGGGEEAFSGVIAASMSASAIAGLLFL